VTVKADKEKRDMKRWLLIILGVLLVGGLGFALMNYTPDLSRGDLEARYQASADDHVAVEGMRVHVRDAGSGPTLVLIHGFGSSLHSWDAWAADLSRDHRVVRLTLPGHGLTGPDPTGDYSDARSLAVIDAVLTAKGVERATLVGNSLGGLLAFKYAAAHPDRVERLVLLAPGGFPNPGYSFGQKTEVPGPMRLLPYSLPESMVRQALTAMYADPARLSDATVDRTRDLMRAPGVRQALVDRLGQLVLEDPVPLLNRIQVPTLVIWGEQDVMVPYAHAEKFMQALPNATLVSWPDMGHIPQEEDPARSLDVLRAFLAQT